MLINKRIVEGSPVAVSVKYNEKTITTEPGEILDVRNFGVLQDQMLAVEAHVMKKNPGYFKQESNPLMAPTSKEAEAQILSLQNNLNESNVLVGELTNENATLRTELNSLKNEQDGYETKIKGLKEQVSELKAKIKNLNHPDTK